jgi:hypothetical protein
MKVLFKLALLTMLWCGVVSAKKPVMRGEGPLSHAFGALPTEALPHDGTGKIDTAGGVTEAAEPSQDNVVSILVGASGNIETDPTETSKQPSIVRKASGAAAAFGTQGETANLETDFAGSVSKSGGSQPTGSNLSIGAALDEDESMADDPYVVWGHDVYANGSLALAEEDTIDDEETRAICQSGTARLVGDTKSKKVPDSSITASSYWKNRGDHGRGQMWRSRLDNRGTTWCAQHNTANQWVQWNLGEEKVITSVMTKGRVNCCAQWVTRYELMYSLNGIAWSSAGRFTGNTDSYSDGLQVNKVTPPRRARYVRIYVTDWHQHISMRADFEGCKYVTTTTTTTNTTTTTTTTTTTNTTESSIVKAGAVSLRMHHAVVLMPTLACLLQLWQMYIA